MFLALHQRQREERETRIYSEIDQSTFGIQRLANMFCQKLSQEQ